MEHHPELRGQGATGHEVQGFTAPPSFLRVEPLSSLCRAWNVCFRNFSAEGLHPLQHLSSLQGLCRNWLRPDLRSKEQILDQLVLEQFLISSTPELQALVLEHGVQTCAELEHLLRNLEAPRDQDHSAPQKWTILDNSEATFLMQNRNKEMTPVGASGLDSPFELAVNVQASLSHEPQESRPQALPEHKKLKEDMAQEQDVILIGVTLENKDGRAPQKLEPELSGDRQEPAGEASLKSQPPQSDAVKTVVRSLTRGGAGRRQRTHTPAPQDEKKAISGLNRAEGPPQGQLQRSQRRQGRTPARGSSADVGTGGTAGSPRPPSCKRPLETVVEPSSHSDRQESDSQLRFSCQHCSKQFFNKSRLELHLRSHEGERPPDPQCPPSSDKQVNTETSQPSSVPKSAPAQAPRTSSQDWPFQCPTCNRAFKYMGSLTLHLRTYHGSGKKLPDAGAGTEPPRDS